MIFLKLIMRLLNKNITAKTADNYMFKALELLLDCIIGSCKQER